MTRDALARLLAPRSQRELRDAIRWIVDDNPDAALALIAALRRTLIMLEANPLVGRTRPELAREFYRFWPLRGFPYILVYNATANPPVVVRVVHQSRDLLEALSDLV